MTDNGTNPGPGAELAALRARLAEAEETLRAIRGGEADALVIAGSAGDEVHLLGGGDHIYRQFIETIREGTATVSAAGVILSCSSSLAHTLRQPLDRLPGSAMRDHLSPDDQEAVASILTQACRATSRRKIHLRTSEGALVPVYLSATVLHGAGTEPVCCLTFTDLEEVISAENALREGETLLRESQIVAGLGSYLLDIPAGRWRSSDVLDKLFGIDAAYERTVEGWLALIHPDDRAGMADYFRNEVQGHGGMFDRDYRIIRRDDQAERWVHGLGRLEYDAHGRLLTMHGTIQDITGRKEAVARILKLTQLYAALSKCNEAVVRSANEEELFTTICRETVELGGMRMVWIGLVDEAGQRVLPVAWCGEGGEYLKGIRITTDAGDPFGRGPTGMAIRENRPSWSQDFGQDPATTPWHEAGVRFGWAASAAFPLTRNGNPVGSLTLYAGKVEAFDGETRRLLTEMAGNISFALDKFAAETERQSTAQALQESEERYRVLFENSPDAVLLTVPDGSILSANPAACRMFGRTLEEFCALGRASIVDTGDPRLARLLGERARTGRVSGELTFLRRDGATFPGEVSSSLFRDRLGAMRTSMIIRDITERKQAEEELRSSRLLYQKTLSSLNEAVFVVDVKTRMVLDCNETTESIFGYSREELIGRDTRQLHVNEETFVAFAVKMHAQIAEKGFAEFEFQMRRKNGDVFPTEHFLRPLQEDGGSRFGIVSVIRDITERKRLETDRLQLSVAIEQAGETVLITDARGTIRYVNPRFEAVTGYAREEVLGRNSRLLKSSELDPAQYRTVLGTIKSGRLWHGRMVNRRKDGTLFTVETTISPVHDEAGRIVSYVGVERDITEELRLVEEKARLEDQLRQAQKVEAIGRLAGGVAHDFNNLTAIVLGYGEMLLGQLTPDTPERRMAEQIVAAGKRSATLTQQLLAFSRRQVLLPVVLDLNELLRNLERMLGRLIGEDVALTFDLAGDLGRVTADPGQLEQVVTNLVINARDAMPQGGRLTVETANTELDEAFARDHVSVVPGEYVRLALTDTGCGMDSATLARLFDPFFTTKGVGKGTGLGLATSFGIVKQSGGYLYVASEPDQGTTFMIYLPRTYAEPKAAETVSRGVAPQGAGERILLVEDEASLLEMCAIILERSGYRVYTAASGPEALALVEEKGCEPDLVVTDVVMPGMSGTELMKRLRGGRPGLKVLYMSGYPDKAIASHGVIGPGVSFLSKPFTESVLATKVSEALGSRTPAAAPQAVRVLMIDDDEQYRELVQIFCRKHGHVFAGVDSAAAALAALAGQPFDVLLVDLNIPGTSGEDVLRKIRAAGHTAPAIVLTGDVASADMDALRPLGAVRALQKSSNAGPLLRAIEKAAALDGPPRDTGAR